MSICALDIETTGLQLPNKAVGTADEILQLAIVAEDNSVLFDELFKPEHKSSWKEAQRCNRITPEMVENAPGFRDRVSDIQRILNCHKVVVFYNAEFDLAFLTNQGLHLEQGKPFCMLKAFSQYRTGGAATKRGQRRYSLAHCASYLRIKVDKYHDALSDAQTTMTCYKALCRRLGLSSPCYRDA